MLGVGCDELHSTSPGRHVALRRHQHADAGGVEEGAAREIDDDSGRGGGRGDRVLDVRAGRHVELADDADDEPRPATSCRRVRQTRSAWSTSPSVGHGSSPRRQRWSAMTDRIVLTMPTDARLRSVATLVLGGVGSRLDLPFERTDDLQLAVLSALEATDGGDVTFEIDADERGFDLRSGRFARGVVRTTRSMRVLSRLVDEVEHERRDGDEWLTLAALDAERARARRRRVGRGYSEISSTSRPVDSGCAVRAMSACARIPTRRPSVTTGSRRTCSLAMR